MPKRDTPINIVTLGDPAGTRRIVAVQPWMTPEDYVTPERFAAKLDDYLAAARDGNLLDAATVVAFPEFLGAWLVVLEEPASVYQAADLRSAMTTILRRHPLGVLHGLLAARGPDRLREALFRRKARRMADVYQRTFSDLARRYHITLLAGSIILPAPHVQDGVLTCNTGPLMHIAVLFHPDGRADDTLIYKTHLTADEQRFLTPGPQPGGAVFILPDVRLGVLICADAWFPECYRPLKEQGAEVVLVPSFITHPLAKPWQGYSGAPPPADVPADEVSRITLGEAWERYALLGRLPKPIPLGIHLCLRGHFWDIPSAGATTITHHGHVTRLPDHDRATLTCIRL